MTVSFNDHELMMLMQAAQPIPVECRSGFLVDLATALSLVGPHGLGRDDCEAAGSVWQR
jgi:hypothetical protein